MKHSINLAEEIKAYLTYQMTPAQRKDFENRLQTDTELAEVVAEEKEMYAFMGVYEEQKAFEAMAFIKEIQANNPDPKPFPYKWLAIAATIIFAMFLSYYCFFQNNPKPDTDLVKKDSNSNIQTPSPSSPFPDSIKTIEIAPVEPHKQFPPAPNPFQDSLQSYQLFAIKIQQQQNELITLLRQNVKLNQAVIDSAYQLWVCNHNKHHGSMGEPKFKLMTDTLVLDSIYKFEQFPALPKDIKKLQEQRKQLLIWQEKENKRRLAAENRKKTLEREYLFSMEDLSACRK